MTAVLERPRTGLVVPLADAAAATALASRMAAQPSLAPFDAAVVEFCVRLGHRLRAAGSAFPELAALGFWLRPAALVRLRDEALAAGPVRRVPRGLVFCVPPANVDTVFAYTWLLSLLLGNRTIVRVPSRAGAGLDELIRRIGETLDEADLPERERLRAGTAVVSYGHDDAVTSALSAACDLRVLWGSDETVARLRRLPLPVHARELAFGDRSALAVLSADAVAALDETALAGLARDLVADVYPFDQLACSSPRGVVWVGAPGAVADRFWAAVRRALDARPAPSTSAGMDALAVAADFAADHPGLRVRSLGTDLTVVSGVRLGADVDAWRARHPGGGLFAEVSVPDAVSVASVVVPHDQTLTYAGLTAAELTELVDGCAARGVDRIVPVGAALQFSRYWDGVDLVTEMTRSVHVPSR